MTGLIFEDRKQEEEEEKEIDIKIPEISDLMKKLEAEEKAAIVQEHIQLEDSMNEDQKKERQQRQRQGGMICFCLRDGCGIGPMIDRP